MTHFTGKHLADGFKAAPEVMSVAEMLALGREGEMLAAWLETLDTATPDELVSFPPPVQPAAKTRLEMLLATKEHEMHHRAQLMLVERLFGIVPHLTKNRHAVK